MPIYDNNLHETLIIANVRNGLTIFLKKLANEAYVCNVLTIFFEQVSE